MVTTKRRILFLFLLLVLMVPLGLMAQESESEAVASETAYALDNMFLLLGAILVIFMQPGFAMVESGFNAAKNAVNILFKNVMDLCVGVLLFFLFGYGIMYGDSILGEFQVWNNK